MLKVWVIPLYRRILPRKTAWKIPFIPSFSITFIKKFCWCRLAFKALEDRWFSCKIRLTSASFRYSMSLLYKRSPGQAAKRFKMEPKEVKITEWNLASIKGVLPPHHIFPFWLQLLNLANMYFDLICFSWSSSIGS